MDGRMISEVVNQQTQNNMYLTDDKILVLVALLCGVIAIVGFVSILPWGWMLRSYDCYVVTKLANTGLNNNFLDSLPSLVYSTARLGLADVVVDAECPICLADFEEGQKLRVLPMCKHAFHVECVDRWFGSHSSCPTCRNCLLRKNEDRVVQFSTSQIPWSGSDDSVEVEEPKRSVEITDIVVMK